MDGVTTESINEPLVLTCIMSYLHTHLIKCIHIGNVYYHSVDIPHNIAFRVTILVAIYGGKSFEICHS